MTCTDDGAAARPDLRWWHLALLRALDERGAFTAAQAGILVWKSGGARAAASTATPALKEMRGWGLVKLLDDQRPMAWLRTPEGTRALGEAEAKVIVQTEEKV